ncbi:hypothetical protein Dsin_001356 [Dipteronia sinensis]|uniref:Uncharacterized protein n=1 Tax=Dipteronia sinensis TaxID=43782 RepID=A0AAE0B555_9ROSI|nr:hypothetical protein Dsin_001356 [Dipteronia sinensis]
MDTNLVSQLGDLKKRRSWLYSIFPAAGLFFLILFIGNAIISPESQQKLSRFKVADALLNSKFKSCKNRCRPSGSEALPEGIVIKESNLQMRPLWGFPKSDNSSINLFAMAVGIKQSDLVDKMVRKFLSSNFVVMLFHYDGNIDGWKSFDWSNRVIHVSAMNQTKWWFAKRFLHPDIVAEYSYIFLWDEDLGVEDFHPNKYLSIVKSEGLEISQPGLDPTKSEVHHQITARASKSVVHRRIFKPGAHGCDKNSMGPPCTGWIEMMAPVFSRDSWRCVWYMIQNDLIHAWGLDTQLGYCAQGDRTKTVGVVDAEYIIHHNLPTLGGVNENKKNVSTSDHSPATKVNKSKETPTAPRKKKSRVKDPRVEVRRQSYIELATFQKRWRKAAEEDQCWTDPYPHSY